MSLLRLPRKAEDSTLKYGLLVEISEFDGAFLARSEYGLVHSIGAHAFLQQPHVDVKGPSRVYAGGCFLGSSRH